MRPQGVCAELRPGERVHLIQSRPSYDTDSPCRAGKVRHVPYLAPSARPTACSSLLAAVLLAACGSSDSSPAGDGTGDGTGDGNMAGGDGGTDGSDNGDNGGGDAGSGNVGGNDALIGSYWLRTDVVARTTQGSIVIPRISSPARWSRSRRASGEVRDDVQVALRGTR